MEWGKKLKRRSATWCIRDMYTCRELKKCVVFSVEQKKIPSNHECSLVASSFSAISFYLYKWEIDPGWAYVCEIFCSTREHWPIDRLMFTLRDTEERKTEKKMFKNALKLLKINVCACVYMVKSQWSRLRKFP